MGEEAMPEVPGPPPRLRKWLRRFGLAVGLLVVLLLIGLAALPWGLGTEVGSRFVLARINEAMAPGRVEIARFRFSYTEPLGLDGVVLRDPEGGEVLRADSGVVDQSLVGLARAAFELSTHRVVPLELTLNNVAMDLRQEADGSINLARALDALFRGDPRTKTGDIWIRMKGGTIRAGEGSLPSPFVGNLEGLDLHLPHHGGPATWDIRLASGEAAEPGSLLLAGLIHRADGENGKRGDLSLKADAKQWPIAYDAKGLSLAGRVSTTAEIIRKGDVIDGHGPFRLIDLRLKETDGRDVEIPSITGSVHVQPRQGDGVPSSHLSAWAEVEQGARLGDDVEAILGRGPLRASVEGDYWAMEGRVGLSAASVEAPAGQLTASGSLTGLAGGGTPAFAVEARLEPSPDRVDQLLAEGGAADFAVENPRVELKASGPFASEALSDPVAHLALDLAGSFDRLTWPGLDISRTVIAANIQGGTAVIQPIRTTLNDGEVEIHAELAETAAGEPVLRLLKGTKIVRATINEELAQNVLKFAVPVLEKATRPSGFVSGVVDRAEFVLDPTEVREPEIEAAVVFEGVEFGPGPLPMTILDVIGKGDARLRLDQPVTLVITGGRVYSHGVTVPIVGDVLVLQFDGSVGFDQTLDLTARIPVTNKMMGDLPVLTDIMAGTGISVPITGTLDQPKLDKLEIEGQLKQLATGAIRGAAEGIRGIGQIFSGMKERQQERRRQREARRYGGGLSP